MPSALGKEKYDVVIREPSLSGKFAEVGIPDRETAQNIYASPDTTARLAEIHPDLLVTAAEITGKDHVIVISHDDVAPILHDIDGGVNTLHNDAYEHYAEAFDSFRLQFSEPPLVIDPGAVNDAYNKNASAVTYNHENGQSYAVIALPDLDQTAKEHFISIADIRNTFKQPNGEYALTDVHMNESKQLDNATSASDILHEAGHAGLGHSASEGNDAKTLGKENEADAVSDLVTPQLFPVVGEEAVALNKGARAVGAMFDGNGKNTHHHDTNMTIHGNGVKPDEQLAAINAVNDIVTKQVAEDAGTDIDEAKNLIKGDPGLVYATVDKLDKIGVFASSEPAQQYVDDFKEAGAERIPEYLGVTEDVATPVEVSSETETVNPDAEETVSIPLPAVDSPEFQVAAAPSV